MLVRWTLSDATANGFGIWRRTDGRWLRMYAERTPSPGGKDPSGLGFTFGDVTQDHLADHRVILRCFRPVQPGHRGCPRVRDRLAMG